LLKRAFRVTGHLKGRFLKRTPKKGLDQIIDNYIYSEEKNIRLAPITPIKHIYRKNQRIFEVGLANHLILLIPKFLGAGEVKKTWCGKYLN
jgi:hypothetical protein